MILIRGIKGESYARKIEKGVVDCRDVLSALLQPPVTGYEYSDYYEKNLVKALTYFSNVDVEDFHNPDFLFSILIDYYIPHIYLTYFHVLNEHSLKWLEKFEDDYQFIAINAKLDRFTQTAIGEEFFGAKMSYVDSISQISQEGFKNFYVACMCSLENQFEDKMEMNIPLQIYNTLAFPLLYREQDEKFTDIENEFRIIAYDCPRIRNGERQQKPREVTIFGKTGIKYRGMLKAGSNCVLKSNLRVLGNPNRWLKDVLIEEQGMITLDSKFKSINIGDISDDYKYLGGKRDCANYINRMLKCKQEDIYVDRTIIKQYKMSDISDAVFAPGYQKVE